MLASYMVRPTEHAKTGLVKLIQYLVNTSHYGICMKCSRPGTRKLYDHVADNGCSDSEDRFSGGVFGCRLERLEEGPEIVWWSELLLERTVHPLHLSFSKVRLSFLHGVGVLLCCWSILSGNLHEGRHRVHEPEPLRPHSVCGQSSM